MTSPVPSPSATPPPSRGPSGRITRTDIVRYAGARGDFNPIHHDEGFATTAGFPTVFSIGMFQAALLATYATDWLGAEAIRRFTVRFSEQVWPGDVLTCTGTVAAVDGNRRSSVELVCASGQTGGTAIAGSAGFELG